MHEIEYFYSAHSAFAYLGSARLLDLAAKRQLRIRHVPIDLKRVMDAAGSVWFRERTRPHYAYFFGREIVRWSEYRNAPVTNGTPTHHHKDMTLPNCLLIAALINGDNIDKLSHGILEAHWRYDADIADPESLSRIVSSLDFDASALLAQASSESVLDAFNLNTEEAINRTVFGSPTYFVDGDMFYGQDHLEFIERAIDQPFRGDWPPASY